MKTTYLFYIGLLTLIWLTFSCKPEPFKTETLYILKNQSNHRVKLKWFSYHHLNNNWVTDSVSITNNDSLSFPRIALGYVEKPFPFTDSIYIIFDDTIRLTYFWGLNILKNPLHIEAYSGGALGEYYYRYRYLITEVDYHQALEGKICPN